MLRDMPCQYHRGLCVDEVLVGFYLAREGTKVSAHSEYTAQVSQGQLGDYGYFTDPKIFSCKGNIFTDMKSLISEADAFPRQHRVTDAKRSPLAVPAKSALSLPRNHVFNSLLASFSSRLTNAYLVTMIVQCIPERESTCMYLVMCLKLD